MAGTELSLAVGLGLAAVAVVIVVIIIMLLACRRSVCTTGIYTPHPPYSLLYANVS